MTGCASFATSGQRRGCCRCRSPQADVKRRYGSYPQEKWDANLALKAYFEKKAGRSMADLLREV